jgi:hypothetical protein
MALNKDEKTKFLFLSRMLERKDLNASIEIVKHGHEDRLKYSECYSFVRDIAMLAKEDKYRSELRLKITETQISECTRLWSEKEKPKERQGLHMFEHSQAESFGKQQFEELFEKLFPGHKLTPR